VPREPVEQVRQDLAPPLRVEAQGERTARHGNRRRRQHDGEPGTILLTLYNRFVRPKGQTPPAAQG
jgi:hypothetical protein